MQQLLSVEISPLSFTEFNLIINYLPRQPLNQVIIWDKIVKSADEAVLKYTNEFVKYALIDQGSELRCGFVKDACKVLSSVN